MTKTKGRALAAFALGIALSSSGAFAQDAAAPAASAPAAGQAAAPGTAAARPPLPANWVKVCDTDPKDAKHKVCLLQKLVLKDNDRIGSVSLRIDSNKNVPVLAVAALPVGMVLLPGLNWQIDKQKPVTVPYWRCTSKFCESEQVLKGSDFLKKMRAGKTLMLTAKGLDNKNFNFPVDLAGFGTEYDRTDAPSSTEYAKKLQQAAGVAAPATPASGQ